jgi:hypothetical protein
MSNGRDDYGSKRDSRRVKTSTKHPYGAFEHRVADSPAYANLSFSARSLLVLLVRQLTKDNNNGHLQATFAWMRPYGFDSQHTIIRGIRELVAHGMIYRSRSGGYQQGAALYAVTWLPIKNREGLSLDGFMPCAWRDWQPESPLQKMQSCEKKSPLQKMQPSNCKNGTWTDPASAYFAGGTPAKSAHNVLVPVGARKADALSADLDLTSRPPKVRNDAAETLRKTCPECGQTFETLTDRKLTCSPTCKKRAQRRHLRLARGEQAPW